MNTTYLVDCPLCHKAKSVEVRYKSFYVDECPYDGTVGFGTEARLDEVVSRCGCHLTAEQIEQCANLVNGHDAELVEDEW